MSLKFSSDSEAKASKLSQNLDEMCLTYHIHSYVTSLSYRLVIIISLKKLVSVITCINRSNYLNSLILLN